MSPSFRADGALAYVRGEDAAFRADVTFVSHLYVRKRHGRAPVRWSEFADRFTVLGWAGRSVVLMRRVPGSRPDLVVFDGPSAGRVLANDAKLIAIAPDGKSLLASVGLMNGPDHAQLQLLRLSDGAVLARRALTELTDPRTRTSVVSWIGGPGQWSGDRVVAATDSGFAVLAVRSDTISVERLVAIELTRDGGGLASLREPKFANPSADTVVGHSIVGGNTDNPRFGAEYVCRWSDAACTRRIVSPELAPRPVDDLSAGSANRSTRGGAAPRPAAGPPVTINQTLDPTTIREENVGSTPQACPPQTAPPIDRAPTFPHVELPVGGEQEQPQQAPQPDEPQGGSQEEPTAEHNLDVCIRAATMWYTQFHFYKHSFKNSDLYIRRYNSNNGVKAGESMTRAGSGIHDDTCIQDEGWLPSGWYDIQQHINKKNDLIKGRVWWLTNKQCGSGIWRTALFIHTEEMANGGQSSTDQRYSWDGSNDYYSNGCIKVSNTDMHTHHQLWSDWDGRHGSFTANNALRVYN